MTDVTAAHHLDGDREHISYLNEKQVWNCISIWIIENYFLSMLKNKLSKMYFKKRTYVNIISDINITYKRFFSYQNESSKIQFGEFQILKLAWLHLYTMETFLQCPMTLRKRKNMNFNTRWLLISACYWNESTKI